MIHDKLTGFMYSPDAYGGAVGEYIYVYSDTLLMKFYYIAPNGDSNLNESQYDASGKEIRMTEYHRRYVPPDTTNSGMFTIDAVQVDSTYRKWVKRSEWNYTYDKWGRKTLIEITNPGSALKSSYKWQYDEKGQITAFEYYVRNKPWFTETGEYFEGGHKFMRTWYDENGNPVHKPGKKAPRYMHKQVFIYKTDAQGRIIETRTENRKGKLIERLVNSYNSQGNLTREVFYDGKGMVALTHVYVYK